MFSCVLSWFLNWLSHLMKTDKLATTHVVSHLLGVNGMLPLSTNDCKVHRLDARRMKAIGTQVGLLDHSPEIYH
jgi:hypothetical protein